MKSAKVVRNIVTTVTDVYGYKVNSHHLGQHCYCVMWQNLDSSLSIFTVITDGTGAVYLNSSDGGKTVLKWENLDNFQTTWLEDEMNKHAGRNGSNEH